MSKDSENVNQIPVKLPEDINKPFFAYGIFKEGQLAYSKIEDYVSHVEYDGEINDCMLKIRDGIPLISSHKTDGYVTKGHIIYFFEGDKEDAYKIISDTEPDALYEWGVTEVKGKEVNVLYGKTPKMGVSNMKPIGVRMLIVSTEIKTLSLVTC